MALIEERMTPLVFQHSLMNLGVETFRRVVVRFAGPVFQHSLMNLGVETINFGVVTPVKKWFQHSLMNLGVETDYGIVVFEKRLRVSAFSDESWGGDHLRDKVHQAADTVSAFSDESWGGDLSIR